jgi:hypothetical protein
MSCDSSDTIDQAIWTKPKFRSVSEQAQDRIEQKFVDTLTRIIVDSLCINYNERRIVRGLLKSVLTEKVSSLLKQFLNHELELLSKTIKRKFNVTADVNYDYATHAKFSDILKEIETLLKKDGGNKR